MRRLMITAVVVAWAAILAPAAVAATATPFGGATVSGGILTLVSNTGDADATNDSSGATFAGTGVTTFSSITTLSAEFDVTDDDCKAGSPRFQIGVQTLSGVKNIHVYFGPAPNFTGCSPNTWASTGNLITSADLRFDTTQLGGPFYDSHAHAVTLAGSYQVTSLSIVVDSGWAFADKEQTVRVRNVEVNAETFFVPEKPQPPAGLNPAQACKQLRDQMGATAFRTMFGTNINGANAFGKCVSHMARMKNDTARQAAITRLDRAAERCVAVGAKGKAKGVKAKATLRLRACLRSAM